MVINLSHGDIKLTSEASGNGFHYLPLTLKR